MLVGDALGVPYEFTHPAEIPAYDAIEMTPPLGFRRAHSGVPPGTWSDDGAQALALLDSLCEKGRLDVPDLGTRLLAWYVRCDYAVGGVVFDVGNQTRDGLLRIQAGVPAERAGRADAQGNGNGALMRVLPLALWHPGPDAQLVADAMRQGLPTHGHLRSQVACAVYCVWARRMLDAPETPYERAFEQTLALLDAPAQAELRAHFAPDWAGSVSGSGYVVDSLHSARHALEGTSFEEVIRRAIQLGNDTDTTACIAGGLAGIRWGEAGIPARWREAMREAHRVEAALARLLEA